MTALLENSRIPQPAPQGSWQMGITNLSSQTLRDIILSLTSISRLIDRKAMQGARLLRRQANFHECAPAEGMELALPASWQLEFRGICRARRHRNDAAKNAWITQAVQHVTVQFGDLIHAAARRMPPPLRSPKGALAPPFAVMPWRNSICVEPAPRPTIISAAPATSAADLRLMMSIDAQHRRQFATAARLFQCAGAPAGRKLAFRHAGDVPPEGFRLAFGAETTLSASAEAGHRHGLMTSAHITRQAMLEPMFGLSQIGLIETMPKYSCRDGQLSIACHFWPIDEVMRFVDILAWDKLQHVQWHLTDDEAWRAEIADIRALTEFRGCLSADAPDRLPQLGVGPARQGGIYTTGDMGGLMARATDLGVEVMTGSEMPGQAAALATRPELVGQGEALARYQPVQGDPDNARNFAMPKSLTVIETVTDALCAILPSHSSQIGGDELAKTARLQSPKAPALRQWQGIANTSELRSRFLGGVKSMLTARGRVLVGWNEVAIGGGVAAEDTLSMAWEHGQIGIVLAAAGYDFVMPPGHVYCLDMAQGDGGLKQGAARAGSASVEEIPKCFRLLAAFQRMSFIICAACKAASSGSISALANGSTSWCSEGIVRWSGWPGPALNKRIGRDFSPNLDCIQIFSRREGQH